MGESKEQLHVIRASTTPPPKKGSKWKWLGPGLLWMVSSVGSGSVLFTPRVGASYTYSFIWLAIFICFLMWVMIREAGRYAVYSGETLLKGAGRLSRKNNTIVWFIFLPQLIAAVAGVGGLAALVGSAFKSSVGGGLTWWACGFVAVTMLLVVAGKYAGVEKGSRIFAFVMLALAFTATFKVFPDLDKITQSATTIPLNDVDPYIIVPWVGTILAGSMGILWFSYWAARKGFGGDMEIKTDEVTKSSNLDPSMLKKLHQWFRLLSLTAGVGVVIGFFVISCFLVLGSELLAPKGILPSGINVVEQLSKLFEGVWGRLGYWMMIVAVLVALGGSIFANQDGWGRSFADMTFVLDKRSVMLNSLKKLFPNYSKGNRHKLMKDFYVLLLTGILPIIMIILVKNPVTIMSISGIVAAVHTPVIILLILYVNVKLLPPACRPTMLVRIVMVIGAVFYAFFGLLQLWQLWH